jgi:signal transduction histidine kinase
LLHPPILDEAGLEDAVRHFTDGFGKRTGIEMEVEVSPRFGRLPEGIELGLFRVIQESLVNIQRHSGSFTAKIVLSRYAENIVLEVSDTGRGISASHRKKNGTVPLAVGVGIPSMEERVKQLGGQLSIDSSSRGTTVSVTVPLHDQGK